MHFQSPPFEQAKLVRCVSGNILDVAVDLRTSSKTYGMSFSVDLSSENNKQLFKQFQRKIELTEKSRKIKNN